MWGTSDDTRTAYLDTVDISRMILASLRSEASHRASLTLAGPKAWTTGEARPPCMRLFSVPHTCSPSVPYMRSNWYPASCSGDMHASKCLEIS